MHDRFPRFPIDLTQFPPDLTRFPTDSESDMPDHRVNSQTREGILAARQSSPTKTHLSPTVVTLATDNQVHCNR